MTNTIDIYQWTVSWAKQSYLHLWTQEETSSTNTVAKEDLDAQTKPVLPASASISQPTLYVTRRQTQGRGRGEHTWTTPPNSSLLASWSFALAQPPQPVLSPQVGLALFEAAMKIWPQVDFSLKAPNDLYIGRLKVAGVLIETVDWGHSRRTVVGLGFNVGVAPEDVPTSTSLAQALGQEAESQLTEKNWREFLTELNAGLKLAVTAGMQTTLSSSVRERLRSALNRNPHLAEPIEMVDELGQLKSASRTVHWQEL